MCKIKGQDMGTFFTSILNMSISASWLILAVILLRAILSKAPKGFRYILWALVAIRLVCPFSIESSFSLVPEMPTIGVEESNPGVSNPNENVSNPNTDITNPSMGVTTPGTNVSRPNTDVTTPNTGVTTPDTDVTSPSTGVTTPNTGVVTPGTDISTPDTDVSTPGTGIVTPSVDKNAQQGAASTEPERTWNDVLLESIPWVWVTDSVLLLVYIVVSYLVLWNKVKISVPVGENTYICDEIRSPFILGIIKPRIYMPSSITKEQMTYIMAHEKEHLRCFDHIWKPLGFVIVALHWFNPLVWVAYVLMCRDLELACDERVIRNMNAEEKRNYSETLLACSSPRSYISACPVAFGEIGIKERIKRVFSYKKPTIWIVGVAVIACVVIAICFMTSPKSDVSGEPSTETESESETESETETEPESELEPDSGDESGDTFDGNSDWNTYVPNISDETTVVYNDSEVISFTFKRVYVPDYVVANPTTFFYGMTVDKQNGGVKYLSEYIPSRDALIGKLEKGEYTVVSGDIQNESKEQIIAYVKEKFTEKNWEAYYSNFYLDKDGICLIFKTSYSDYSILKVVPEDNWKKDAGNQNRPQLTPDSSYDYEGELFSPYVDDSVEIIYHTEKEFSIISERLLYIPPAAHPISYCYGITVNQNTNKISFVSEYVTSLEQLVKIIESEKYSVVRGEFELNTKEEIIEHLTYQFSAEDWQKNYSNFYVDQDYVYIIAGDTFGYYSVLKIDRRDLEITWNSEAGVSEEELNILQKVLLNKETFHDGKRLSDLMRDFSKYYVVDLDRDGINEVIAKSTDEKYVILHLMDNEVYYYLWNSCIDNVYWDGTFVNAEYYDFTGKHVNQWNYYGAFIFEKETFFYHVIVSALRDASGMVHYYKGGEAGQANAVEISKTEFNYIMLNYDITKEGYGTWDNASIENILKDVTLEAQTEPEYPIDVTVADSELSLMQKVLLNKATFNDGQKMTDVPWFFQYSEDNNLGGKYTDFCVVDLDHDGVDEVIVTGTDVLILHQEQNQVYGYMQVFRGMNHISVDGTYWGSSGASDNYFFGNVFFENYEMIEPVIAATAFDGSKEEQMAFYKNGVKYDENAIEITEEEYLEILSQYTAEEAEHYAFTLENVLKYVD